MKTIAFLILSVLFFSDIFAQSNQGAQEESKLKIVGEVFGDYFFKAGGDSTAGVLEYSRYKKDFNAFAFRRVYFAAEYTFNEKFDAKFGLSYDGNADTLPNGSRTVYVKDAFVKWKNVFKNADLTFGIFPTIGYSYIDDKWWGYRSIERTIMDQRGFLSSRDMGIMLNGTFDDAKNFGYYAMIGNGRGARLENNKYKRYYAMLFGSFIEKKLVMDIYSDYETVSPDQNRTLLNFFIGYKSGGTTLGLENFAQFLSNFNTSPTRESSDIVPYGISFYFAQDIKKEVLKAWFRYDNFNQDLNNSKTGFRQSFVSTGLDWMPYANVHIMPNLWLNAFTPKPDQTVKYTTDVVPRITVWYNYK